jgi:hypothetical protein
VLVLVLGLGLAIVIVIVLDSRQLEQRRGRHGSWPSIKKSSPCTAWQAASGAYRIDALANDRKPAIASGTRHENKYEHDDDCESEHEHESCLAEA